MSSNCRGILLSHPTGNANVRETAKGLQEADMLDSFHISLAVTEGGNLAKLFSAIGLKEVNRRAYEPELGKALRLHPCQEIGRQLAGRLGLKGLLRHEEGLFCVDAVYRSFDRTVARWVERHRTSLSAVYAYEDGALATFQAARARGVTCLYDLPIAYWRLGRQIHSEEADLQPEWAMTLTGLQDSPAKLARKDAELAHADAIFCASSFTRDSLKLYPDGLDKPIHVVPYGAPQAPAHVTYALPPREPGKPLRALFVGGLSQRKGLSYLFEAVRKLGLAVELTVIGKRPAGTCPALDRELAKHRYIESLPHDGILAEMERADVFVFPSLFEGFGLVLLEAMSRGVPCITTAHTAGPDFMTDGQDGYIVPIRDSDIIAERLELLHGDRDLLASMQMAARATATRQTWKAYQDGMVAAIRPYLDS